MLGKNVCSSCHTILIKEIESDHNYNISQDYQVFAKFVNRGKLYFPSKAVYEVVKYTERVFKAEIGLGYLGKTSFKRRILHLVLQNFLPKMHSIFVPAHSIVDLHEELHKVQIIKYISNYYCNFRIQTHAKKQL